MSSIPRRASAPLPGAEPFAAGVRAAGPVVLGYVAIGFAFGVVGRTAGLTVAEIALMSLIVYAGSAQFVGAGMLAAGDPAGAIVSTTFLVNLRHLLLSAALAPSFRHLPAWKSFLAGAELTDETFAVASAHLAVTNPDGRARPVSAPWMFGLNLTSQATWIAATVAGGLFGQAVGDPAALGLDFALAAMFVGLLILQVTDGKKAAVAGLAAALAVGAGLLLPGRWDVVIATVVAATAGAVWDRWPATR